MFNYPIHLLSVEDNPGDARLLVELLSEIGTYNTAPIGEVVNAPSLAAAKLALETKSFDLILLDLTLPDSVGLDTLKAIHSVAANTPIVVMSGLEDDLAERLERR